MESEVHSHSFNDDVSVHEVLWHFVRSDSTLDAVRDECDLKEPDPDLYDERVELLEKYRKPWPAGAKELLWRYEPLRREVLKSVVTPWNGWTVRNVVQEMPRRDPVRFAKTLNVHWGSFTKINNYAHGDACGFDPAYRTTILVREDKRLVIKDGTHRLCAVWQRFGNGEAAWPENLGAFVAERNECDFRK